MNDRLLQVSVRVPVEEEEAVAELFATTFRQPPALATDEETLITEVSAYCTDAKVWTPRRQVQLERGLERLHAAGKVSRKPRWCSRNIRTRDWANSWKRHFQPLEIGGRLLVRPSWSRRRAKAGQTEVVLDPGLSFGTGQHPTTAFCLEQIVRHRPRGCPRSFLDIGTGSGILAISAWKLGYTRVEAFDFDPAAVRAAAENVARNGIDRTLKLTRRNLIRQPRVPRVRFDVVGANLLADLLLRERDRIVARVLPGGVLVLAGILTREFPEVRAAYERCALKLIATRRVNEWQSGAFRAPNRLPKHV